MLSPCAASPDVGTGKVFALGMMGSAGYVLCGMGWMQSFMAGPWGDQKAPS